MNITPMRGRKIHYAVTLLWGMACLSGAASADPVPPEPAAKFEVADVHASAKSTNPDTGDMSGGLMRGGLYRLRRATMLDLVRLAYGVDAKKVLGGPSWLELDRFDVQAKAPAGTTAATVKPLLQALLAERFSLVVHNDTKPVPAWALTATKHPQLKKAEDSDKNGCRLDNPSGEGSNGGSAQPAVRQFEITCHSMTMEALAAGMSDLPGAWAFLNDNLVVDQTGLQGAWDFNLKMSQRWGVTTAGAEIISLFDGLEKIGLKLDPAMVPMPVVVVDSVNRAPTPDSPEALKAFPPPPTEFEVAEVKMSAPETHDVNFRIQPGGRVNVQGATLKFMIEEIWGITDDMLVGAPKSLDEQRWDVVAKAPDIIAEGGGDDADADFDALFAMFRALLADRFKLAVHYEEKPVSAYTMTASKPKLKKADPNSRTSCKEGPPTLMKIDPRSSNPVLGRLLSCTNTSMAYLADQLQYVANGYVHSPVLDNTGLEGGYDFTLSFSTIGQFRGGTLPPPGTTASDPNGAISLPDAMEKQLGLKMELVKRPVKVLVIDHVEEKPTDN